MVGSYVEGAQQVVQAGVRSWRRVAGGVEVVSQDGEQQHGRAQEGRQHLHATHTPTDRQAHGRTGSACLPVSGPSQDMGTDR